MIDLKTKGYTVIPNFLSQDEIGMFLTDYDKVKSTNLESHPEIVNPASADLPKKIFSKLTQVSKDSGLDVDMLIRGGIYTSTSSMNMPWHQDHESYYFEQHLYNYLNFYIILKKDDPLLSGLSVIPFDLLSQSVPDYVDMFVNSGAKIFYPKENSTVIKDDEKGTEWILPFNINLIMQSPKLSVGDLLLLRGDTIHKTQDALTNRVALSIRCTRSSTLINFKKMQQGSQFKKQWLSSVEYERAFKNGELEFMSTQEFYSKIFPGKHTSKYFCIME